MPNKTTSHFSARRRLIVAAISSCFVTAPAWSNPTAPQVVNGSASFNQAGKLLTVTNSNGAIINWSTFSIGANETTRFNQASANSSVLNRVLANDPSVLLGALSSNGRVWLVNPAGIMVGQGARIDVAGFVASTLNVRNEDFLAGRLNFAGTPNAGRIENHGQITTPSGGSVYLIAPAVENHGIINAPNGEVILAAGQTAQLIDTGTPGVKVDITGADGNVTNLGAIVAEAGRIGMAGVLVKNSGTLNASSLVKEGGRIFLKASGDAYVDGAGRIVATGTKGGSIEVLGNRVAVMDQARLDASGNTGGGAVLVGGDYQGKNPDVQNAAITYLGPNASIKADTTQYGDGGKVIVWADDTTRAYGNISARGGANGGNGGFVETSGKRYLDVSGIQVDARGVQGTSGTWLLDPNDISIISGIGVAQPGSPFLFAPPTTSTITDGTINATLNAGTNVKIKTTSGGTGGNGDILMAANAAILTSTAGRELELELEAERNINLQGSIGTSSTGTYSTGSLSVQLSPGNSGKVTTGVGQSFTLNGAGGALEVRILNGKTWENDGTVNLSGNGSIGLRDASSNYATFWNKSAGIVNINSTQGWAFKTWPGDPSQAGIVNNDGTVNVSLGTAFEAAYSQSGTLNIADTNFLNLQNAISLSGSVNLNASGMLNINENHGTPAALTNLSFPGSGGLLNVSGGKTVNFGNVDAGNVALFVGGAAIVNVLNGYAVFNSLSTDGGTLGAINNGTLGIASGNFSIPNGVTYNGDVGYFAAGNLTVNNSVTVPGALKLIAGWDGNIASPGTTGATGNVRITGFTESPTTVAAGTLSIDAGSGVALVNYGGAAGLSSTDSIRIRTGSGGLSLPPGTSIAASGDVELAPIGNTDMCIASGVACAGLFSIDPSILSRVSPTGALILGRAVADTSYTGTLTVKNGTTIPSSVVNGSRLALNGYDVIIESNTSIGDSEITFNKPLDILANRHLTADGNINLGSAQNLLMKAGQFDIGSLTVNGAAVAGGSITLNNPRGDVTGFGSLQTPPSGTLSVDANGGISLTGSNRVGTFVATNAGSGDIEFYNTGNFNLGTVSNSATNAGIVIASGTSGSITQTGDLTTSGGPITVIADTDLKMGSATKAQSAGGTITYVASSGSVQLGLLDAGAGFVTVVAGKNITDGNGALANNIKAGSAQLVASNADAGPGSIDVDTQVLSLFVNNDMVYSTSGQPDNPVTVRNSGSPLTVSVLSASDTGQLTITNDNSINVGHIGGATNTTIATTGASSDITVAGSSSATLLSEGNIVLIAGRDISVTHDRVVAGGSVTATANRDIRIASDQYDPAFIQAANGIDLTMQTGGLYIDGNATNTAYVTAGGNINVATSTGFKNGSVSGYGVPDALSAPDGRWLVYAPNPGSVSKNGLASDFRHYNGTFGNYAPGSVTESGNGFIYASAAGNLTVATNLASGTGSNTYGVAPTASFGYTLAGFADSEDSAGNIGLAGTAAFTPTLAAKTNAGSYTVAYANGLTSSAGYGFLAGPGVAYTVNPASLTLSAVSDTKVYNGTTASSLTPTITGLVSGDTVTGVSQSFGSRHALGVGASTLLVDTGNGRNVVNDANGGRNYIVSTQDTNGTITPAPLTVSATGQNRVYDGTTSATVSLGDNRIGGDVLTLAYGSAAFNDKNAGSVKPVNVSGLTLTGADSGDYRLSSSTAATTADITVRPLSTWIGGASGNWSVAANWDALPDLSNVLAVSVPAGKSVTYDPAAGSTNLASLTAAGLSIAGGSLNIANSLTVNSSFSQTGGTLVFGSGASASITQASGNLDLPAFTVANLSLKAPAGAITQSGRFAVLTLNTQSQGATTLNNPDNQVSGRVDMTAGGPLKLSASGDLNLGAISAGANPVEIKAGHDVIIAAGNVTATTASVAAGHDISAEFTGDLHLNGSGFTAGNDIFVNMLGATSTLYLNDAAGLPRSFLWAQAPSTIHLDFPARASGGMVVDGVAADPLKFAAASGASGLFYGAAMAPATLGAGLKVAYATNVPGATTVAPTVVDAVVAAISASTAPVTRSAGPLAADGFDANRSQSSASVGTQGADQIGGTEGTFGGSSGAKKDDKDDKNKTDKETGLKKQADKPTAKKLATCS